MSITLVAGYMWATPSSTEGDLHKSPGPEEGYAPTSNSLDCFDRQRRYVWNTNNNDNNNKLTWQIHGYTYIWNFSLRKWRGVAESVAHHLLDFLFIICPEYVSLWKIYIYVCPCLMLKILINYIVIDKYWSVNKLSVVFFKKHKEIQLVCKNQEEYIYKWKS